MTVLEQGDVFFLYRNVVGVERAEGLDDVQHLFVVLVPDDSRHGRVLVVGKKRLPELGTDRSDPDARVWLMTLASDRPERLAERFSPLAYDTETEGRKRQAESMPAGAGRYAIQSSGEEDETFLVYRLARPGTPGAAQEALGIAAEGGYVVAVRNPEVDVPGFPDARPDYPEELASKFGDLRWLEVTDPALLDHADAQLVLIGAFGDVDDEGLDLSGEPDFFATFGLDRDAWPTEALDEGRFARARYPVPDVEPEGDRSEAGKRGGRAALEAPSAAGIARALKGIRFPADRDGLVAHAEEGDATAEIVETLTDLPDRRFEDMADVEKALGEVR